MADIFISYSKADHALALKLSAFLEAEGWTVWWDKSLGVADLYRDEIMKQLAAARAVITIWTPNGIKSDWVRAEAGRAKAEGKLIPVKTPDVAYADIPLPFGEMHTENVGSSDLLRAAIVALLAKPETPAAPYWQITSLFKYQTLTWIGIVGSATTLFAGLNTVLNLADWMKWLVSQWNDWTQIFWGWVFSLVNIRLPKELAPVVSFTAFAAMLIVGVNLQARTASSSVGLPNDIPMKRKLRVFIGGVLLYLATILVIGIIFAGIMWLVSNYMSYMEAITNVIAAMILGIVMPIGFPVAYLLYTGKEPEWIFVNSVLVMFMGLSLLVLPLVHNLPPTVTVLSRYGVHMALPDVVSPGGLLSHAVLAISSLMLFQILWMAVIILSPLKQLTRRLGFVVLGVVMLVVLSEISKLNLHQYLHPP